MRADSHQKLVSIRPKKNHIGRVKTNGKAKRGVRVTEMANRCVTVKERKGTDNFKTDSGQKNAGGPKWRLSRSGSGEEEIKGLRLQHRGLEGADLQGEGKKGKLRQRPWNRKNMDNQGPRAL